MSSQSGYAKDSSLEQAPWFIDKNLDLRVNKQALTRGEKGRASAFDLIGRVLSVDEASTSSSQKTGTSWWISVNLAATVGLVQYRLAWEKYSFVKVSGVHNLLAHIPSDERAAARKSGSAPFRGEICFVCDYVDFLSMFPFPSICLCVAVSLSFFFASS